MGLGALVSPGWGVSVSLVLKDLPTQAQALHPTLLSLPGSLMDLGPTSILLHLWGGKALEMDSLRFDS